MIDVRIIGPMLYSILKFFMDRIDCITLEFTEKIYLLFTPLEKFAKESIRYPKERL